VPEATVTAHEAALTILETQITDGSLLARVADTENISGAWNFTSGTKIDFTAGITIGPNKGWLNHAGTTYRMRGVVAGDTIQISAADSGDVERALLFGDPDGSTRLYYTGTQKLATAADGIDVTGDVGGTTIGGITEANLVDKTAAEEISGIWEVQDDVHFAFGNDKDAYIEFDTTVGSGGFTIDINTAGSLVLRENQDIIFDLWSDGNNGSETGQIRFRSRKNAGGQGAEGQIMGFMNFERQTTAARADISWGLVDDDTAGDAVEVMRLDSDGLLDIRPQDSTGGLRIYDSGTTDYVTMSHDGTDFWATGVNTRFFYFNDLTDSVTILDGAGLRLYDSGNTDYVKMSHNGTDFVFAGTNTREYLFGTSNALGGSIGGGMTGTHGVVLSETAQSDVLHLSMYNPETVNNRRASLFLNDATGEYGLTSTASSGLPDFVMYSSTNEIMRADSNDVYFGTHLTVKGGHGLYIQDPGDTDYVKMSHDGTDFNADFTSTTDWNVTGLTGYIRVEDDADLRLVGGIYYFYNSAETDYGYVRDTGSQSQWLTNVNPIYLYPEFDTVGDWTYFLGKDTAQYRANTYIQGGHAVRVYDSVDTDYIEIADDGTRTRFRNLNNPISFEPEYTAAGQRQAQMGDGYFYLYNNVQFRIFDATNSDFIAMWHDGTDFNIDFTNTTECNWSGTDLQMQDNAVIRPEIKDYGITKHAETSSAGTLTIDMSLGNAVEYTFTENVTTVTISNPPASGTYGEVWLKLIQHASAAKTITWAAKYKFPGGTDHVMSTSTGAVDLIHLCTIDGGTTYYCTFVQGLA
jgi:hypothetical protein